jgi:hypothetical protein
MCHQFATASQRYVELVHLKTKGEFPSDWEENLKDHRRLIEQMVAQDPRNRPSESSAALLWAIDTHTVTHTHTHTHTLTHTHTGTRELLKSELLPADIEDEKLTDAVRALTRARGPTQSRKLLTALFDRAPNEVQLHTYVAFVAVYSTAVYMRTPTKYTRARTHAHSHTHTRAHTHTRTTHTRAHTYTHTAHGCHHVFSHICNTNLLAYQPALCCISHLCSDTTTALSPRLSVATLRRRFSTCFAGTQQRRFAFRCSCPCQSRLRKTALA